MLFFRRRPLSASNPTSNRPASIEGLEDRRLLSAAVLHADTAGHSTPGVHSHVSHLHVGGTVVGTTADTITISTGGAAGSTSTTTYDVDSAATITANGTAVTLDKLVAGVKVVLTVNSTDPTTATAIKAIATKVTGVVSAVDTTGNTISVAVRRGATPTTYAIPADATVTVNHVAGTLADITVGSTVHLQFSALSGTTVASVASHTKLSGSLANSSTPTTGASSSTNTGAASTTSGSSPATPSTDTSTGTTPTGSSSGSSSSSTTSSGATTSGGDSGNDDDGGFGFGFGGIGQQFTFGTLVSVDTTANTITLSNPWDNSGSSSTTAYTLASGATITADGATATLGALAVGDGISLTLSSATPVTVSAITAIGKSLDGAVTAVDTTAGTITLTPDDGSASTTVTIPSAATITVDGVTGTLAGVTTGSQVHIQYSALDNTTITSVTDFSLPAEFPGGGFGGFFNNDSAFGALVSVDTTANTITLSTDGWGSATATQTTYTLGSGATITADGATATLGALAVGDQIDLSLTSATPATVTAIKATGKTLGGQVTAVDTTADTITLTPDDGSASTTVTIPSAATIKVDGAAGTLTGVTTGSQVIIQYSALDNTTITSVNDFSLPTGPGGGFGGGDHHNNDSAFGTLVGVDTTANTITLSSNSRGSAMATQTTYTLGAGATITADGATATLGALSVGDQITLTLSSSTPTTVTAIKASGTSLDGAVTAVDTTAGTITLTPDDGSASTTVTIPSTATITVDGATGTLAGITTGSQVHIKYSALDNTMVVSVNDFSLPSGPGGGDHNHDSAYGTLVSVDTTANTITLSSNGWDSSSPTQTTYTLGAGATITADGATATLGGLAVGDQISLSLSSTTPATVTAIKATGKSLDGQVSAVDTTANTITLTPDDGSASTTVTIPAGATITVNGASGMLSGITTGAQVHIQYSALDNTQIISVGAFTIPSGFGDGGGGGFGFGGGDGGGGSTNFGGNGNAGGIFGGAGFGIGL